MLGPLDDIQDVVQVVLLDENASGEIVKKRTTIMISGSAITIRKGQVVKKTSNNSGAGTRPRGVARGMMKRRRQGRTTRMGAA